MLRSRYAASVCAALVAPTSGLMRPRQPAGRLADALSRRLRATVDGPLLSDRKAKIVLDAGPHEVATLTLADSRLSYRAGASHSATTLVTSDVSTMTAVVEGRESGAHMFLGHRLGARGNLSLALVMDGLFDTTWTGSAARSTGPGPGWSRPGASPPRTSKPARATHRRSCCCTASAPPTPPCSPCCGIWPRTTTSWPRTCRASGRRGARVAATARPGSPPGS